MSSRIVRTVTKVKDVTKLADHVTSDNDIISDIDGNIFLKQGTNNYVQLALNEDNNSLQSQITSLKSENTKLKNRLSTLETSNENLNSSLQKLETSNEDLITRIEALENADTTTE